LPLYEYECGKCHHRFEKIEAMSASTTKKCPKCGAKAERRFAAPAIQFKGSGWYVTDYGGKGSSSEGGASKEGGSDSSAKSEKSSDAKSSDSKSSDSSDSKSKDSSSKSEKPSKKK
jgi:putative FmdB family regulatory protein